MSEITCLHHVGFVVASIQTAAQGFTASLSARWDGTIVHDPLQRANVAFLRTPGAADALIELVEPAGEDSPVRRFLEKGGGLHHLCYEVEDMDASLAKMRLERAVVVKRPLPAVAFGNRRIAWIFTRQKLLVELLERDPRP
jgi:methylmalonyl-CoA/ethylmalonyl-CoA epimerase